jgi:hypothetical protein
MHKSQCRNANNIQKQGNLTLPKAHNSSISEFKDTEISVKDLKLLFLKSIQDLEKSG